MMTFKCLLLLALGAASLSGCAAAVVAPALAPLVAFPPSLQGDDSPKVTDAVSPVPGEAVFYNITYEEHDTRYPAPQPEPGVERHRSASVYGVDDDYAATWQSLGAPQTFLTVQDLDLKYSDGSIGKRRIVRLKATSQSPGVEGANPSFTGISRSGHAPPTPPVSSTHRKRMAIMPASSPGRTISITSSVVPPR